MGESQSRECVNYMNPIRLLNLGLVPPLQTQSIYHALAENMTRDSQDVIIICQRMINGLSLQGWDKSQVEKAN